MTNITQGEFDFNPIPVETKVCTKCKQELPVDMFTLEKRASGKYHRLSRCKPCSNAAKDAWVERRKEHVDAYRKNYYEANREKIIARMNKWVEEHRERHNATFRRRLANSPEIVKAERTAGSHTKRARKRGLPGKWSGREWLALKAKYGNKCLCCGKTEAEVKLTPDMIVPFAKNGENTLENLQVLCLDCNDRKGRKIIDYRP